MKNNSRTHKTMINTSFGVINTTTRIIATFIIRTIFIRTLGIQYAGVASLFTDILTVLSFAELGISSAITFSLYEPIANSDHQLISNLMYFIRRAYKKVALIVFVAGISLIPFLDRVVNDVPDVNENITVIYLLFLLNTVVSYLFIYKSTLFIADQKEYKVSRIDLFFSLIKLSFEVIILLILKSYYVYLIFGILVNTVKNFTISMNADKEYSAIKNVVPLKLDVVERKRIIENIKALAIYRVSAVVLAGTDSVLISIFLGTSTVGVYANYTLIKNAINSIISQIYRAIIPSIGNLAIEGNIEEQYRIFKNVMFIIFWIGSFSSVSLLVMYNPFISLMWGEKYLLDLSIVAIIILNFYIVKILSVLESFRTANGLFIQGKYRPLLMAILNIVLSVFFVKHLGLIGIIMGTILSRVLTQIWYDPWLVYRNIFKKPLYDYFYLYFKYLLITIFSCFITYIIANLNLVENQYIEFVYKLIMCITIPNLIIIIIFNKTSEFRFTTDIFKRYLKRVINRL